jgi:hypothetical protein
MPWRQLAASAMAGPGSFVITVLVFVATATSPAVNFDGLSPEFFV